MAKKVPEDIVFAQLCWKCKRSTNVNMCPWVRNGTPVPGWKATPTYIKSNDGFEESYAIRECPLFVKE